MSTWTPESEREPEAVEILTAPVFHLRLVATTHDYQEEGQTPFATMLMGWQGDPRERRIAQGMLPTKDFEALASSGLFDEPVGLHLRAVEQVDGLIEGVLSAVVNLQKFLAWHRARAIEKEPWLASLPPEEPLAPDTDAEGKVQGVPIALGKVVRFPANREHRDNLAQEVMALFTALLSGSAMDANAKQIENLLDSL